MRTRLYLRRLFVKHPASRQRNLYLRTFNVVPLTEDCGIIQWYCAHSLLTLACREFFLDRYV